AVHPGAVGAVEVGQDDVAVLGLDLGVVAADPLVVEPQDVPLLAADRNRHRHVPVHAPLVDAFENEERHGTHSEILHVCAGAAGSRPGSWSYSTNLGPAPFRVRNRTPVP